MNKEKVQNNVHKFEKCMYTGTYTAVEGTAMPPVDTPVFRENQAFTNKVLGLPSSFRWTPRREEVCPITNIYIQIVFPMLARMYQLMLEPEFTNTTLEKYEMQATTGTTINYHTKTKKT
jgi:hypothetical protein